jgi:hypothetical protein
MPQRSITDEEIALIKGMLRRGMPNKDIQFFFNRPDRAVNSGRISGIRDRTYGPSATISAASDDELDAFFATHPGDARGVTVVASEGREPIDADPLSKDRIQRWFSRGPDGLWRFSGGESDRHECKAGFGFKHQDKWLRPIAALANNAGGYIFFGVNDKEAKGPGGEDLSNVVVGLDTDDFETADPASFATRVKAVFDPTPQFEIGTAKVGGKTVGVLFVHRHSSRPVIATKNEGSLVKEGDIFFRYPGQSARIKYSDLRAMLDARDAETRRQLVPMMGRLLRLGPDRAMIADLEAGKLTDASTSIQLDKSLVEKLTFIKEGQFSETEGAPTLRLIGEVEAVSREAARIEYGLLTRKQVLGAFLNQIAPEDPALYIRWTVESGEGAWLPLHYFAKLAGLTRQQLIEVINSTEATSARKKTYITHVRPNAPFKKAQGKPKAILDEILTGSLPTPTTPQEASHVGQALQALPTGAELELKPVLELLKTCLDLTASKPAASFVRRGLCRVDELAFAEKAKG